MTADPFAWGVPETVTARLRPHFERIETRTAAVPWRFPSASAARAFLQERSSTHIAAARGSLPEASRAAFDAIERLHADVAGPDGEIDVPVGYLVVTALRR